MPRQWLTNWMPGIPQRGTWMPRINSWCQGGWGFQELNFLTLYSSGSFSFRDHGSTLYVSCISLKSDFVVWHKHIQWIMTPLSTHLPYIFAITPHPSILCHVPDSWFHCDPFSLIRAFCVTKRLEKSISSQIFSCSRLLKICEHYKMCFAGEPLTECASVTATRRCWSWKI